LTFNSFCGGAPFNVAVNAKKAGATVGFIGRVGKDVIGRFVTDEAKKGDYFYLPFVAENKFTVSTKTNATLIECLPSKQD
jgi:sugar/nucleoside kinase (ribokinase family)